MTDAEKKDGEQDSKPQGDLVLLGRLFREARPFLKGLILFLAVSLMATPVALLTPVPLKIAVDSGLGDTPLPSILRNVLPASLTDSQGGIILLAAIMVVLVMLLTQLQWVATALIRTLLSERMVLGFRAKLFRHVQNLSFSFHDQRGSSDSTYRIQWDAASIQHVTVDGLIPFISSMLTLAAMLWVTFALNWQLGLVALGVSPIMIWIALHFRPLLRQRAKELKKRESAAFSVIPETLGALRVVKAFGQENREQNRFVDESQASLRAKFRYMITESGMGMLVGIATALGTSLVLYVGARQVVSGSLSLGQLLMVMTYISQLYGPLKSISGRAATMQSHLASAERALSLLDQPYDVKEKPGALELVRARGRVCFNDVTFRYADGPEILSGVNLRVEPGTRVGIAGRTGAGKTTLISLLMRFYDVSGGAILIDGVDIRDYRVADLRRQFSIVLQDPVLFSTSIRENIAYGRPDASEEEIIRAAEAANAHQFISELPEGYETRVGERGMRLSGGERQRISLARAFLTDSPILILDEPTSSVDVKTEDLIMQALSRLMSGRTTFMIAHRLGTLENCDLTVTLGDGTIEKQLSADPELVPVSDQT
jgi:ATP-binding cassette subfamily B protein